MTKRPENVKCENCVFWDPTGDPPGEPSLEGLGWCRRYPSEDVAYDPLTVWCGEFRSSWPEEAR